MSVISLEQLQEALEKSRSYMDLAVESLETEIDSLPKTTIMVTDEGLGMSIQEIDDVPEAEDADESVLYAVPTAGSINGSVFFENLYDSGYLAQPYYVDLYTKMDLDGEEYLAALGMQSTVVEYLYLQILAAGLRIDDLETSVLDLQSSLESRISALEEQVSALTASDTSETEDSGTEE